jgi:hypothetical protein
MRGDGGMAWGDFYKPSDGLDVVKASARSEFLDAIVRVAPKAIRSLQADVFPLYKEVHRVRGTKANDDIFPEHELSHMQQARWMRGHAARVRDLPSVEPYALTKEEEAYVNLYDALGAWQERYHLTEEWISERVLHEFRYEWRDTLKPDDSQLQMPFGSRWRVVTAWGCPVDDEDCLFEFRLPAGWDPTSLHWRYFEIELKTQFRKFVAEYRQHLEKFVMSHGFVRSPVMRHPEKHFDMLALRIVRRQSYGRIASQYGSTIPGVFRAIGAAARLADIPLPEARRGRPRGSKKPKQAAKS